LTTTLNASTAGAGGFIATGDNSGSLALQTAGTTAVTIDTSQNATFAGKVTSAGALTLASNGTTTAVTIDTSQNVGIGTASPGSKLDILNTTTAQAQFSYNASIYGRIGRLSSGNYEFSAYENGAALTFGTSGTNSSTTERMRIDSSGNLLVGTTSAVSSAAYINLKVNPASKWGMGIQASVTDSFNAMVFNNVAGSTVGTIVPGASSTAYNTSSDHRLKENIAPMTGALNTVSQLKPVTYKWKIDGSASQGFIAHELQAVVPECVTGSKDAVDEHGNPVYQGIDTSFLVATLTAAIQELSAKNDALTARVVALESK